MTDRSPATTFLALIIATLLPVPGQSASAPEHPNPLSYEQWSNGPSADPSFFPLAVWLQSPKNARRYRQAGINTYVALWHGPTEEQLNILRAAGMKLICNQNAVALQHLDDSLIIAWMHGDEPDNAQSQGRGKGYGPPVAAQKIVEDYERLRQKDPSRPILLNLGQGVAWDNWIGRGVRRNHPEDYPEYLKGCDIASFDIYPATHENPEVAGNLWFVARGVERLVKWGGGRKIIWNCLESTRISNVNRKPSPQEVRCEAWMAIIHGSQGLIYFVHQFKPAFREAALLDDPDMLAEVTALNREITQLAPVLNSPTLARSVECTSSNPEAPVAHMTKQHQGTTYLFTVGMRGAKTSATFHSSKFESTTEVEVLGENRRLTLRDGEFTDGFEPWAVHLYRLRP